jgi:hypothetical protein
MICFAERREVSDEAIWVKRSRTKSGGHKVGIQGRQWAWEICTLWCGPAI